MYRGIKLKDLACILWNCHNDRHENYDNDPTNYSDNSPNDPTGIPDTAAEIFPDEFDGKTGHTKETIIPEMLAMGHLMEAGRLIAGKEFFLEPAETIELPERPPKQPE